MVFYTPVPLLSLKQHSRNGCNFSLWHYERTLLACILSLAIFSEFLNCAAACSQRCVPRETSRALACSVCTP